MHVAADALISAFEMFAGSTLSHELGLFRSLDLPVFEKTR